MNDERKEHIYRMKEVYMCFIRLIYIKRKSERIHRVNALGNIKRIKQSIKNNISLKK